MINRAVAVAVVCAILSTGPIGAQEMKLGSSLSTTGPAASIGIPMKNTFQILPKDIGALPLAWTIFDDATDTTLARRNIEKLTAEGVDIIIGSNTTPTSLAMIEVAARTHTPMIAIGPSPSIVSPVDAQRNWVFKVPLGEPELAEKTLRHMAAKGIKTFAFIGFNDALGDGWLSELSRLAPQFGLKMTGIEKYGRTDSSVTAQILKILVGRPDAVFVGATGTPAILPTAALIERGYRGKIYQTSGVINNDFLRVGGKSVEGVYLAGNALVVAEQLPDSNPSKAPALAFKTLFEATYGRGSVTAFGGNAYDVWLILKTVVPVALQKAKPGTEAFRVALRDAIEDIHDLPTVSGVMTMSKTNHGGYSPNDPVMLTVRNGGWALAD